jgi:hypothetical protein
MRALIGRGRLTSVLIIMPKLEILAARVSGGASGKARETGPGQASTDTVRIWRIASAHSKAATPRSSRRKRTGSAPRPAS